MSTPRIYVVSMSDYNAGVIHGCWIDADQDADEIHAEIAAMLRGSRFPDVQVECPECEGKGCDDCKQSGKVPSAEEWAIHGYEGFDPLELSEWEPIEKVSELGRGIEEHGEAFALFAAKQGGNVTVEDFEEAYIGTFYSETDWAKKFLRNAGLLDAVPDELRNYIDFEAYARDAQISGGIQFERDSEGNLHVFQD